MNNAVDSPVPIPALLSADLKELPRSTPSGTLRAIVPGRKSNAILPEELLPDSYFYRTTAIHLFVLLTQSLVQPFYLYAGSLAERKSMLIRNACFILCSFLISHSVPAFGFSSNARLLQLVPPGSQIVAAMLTPTIPGEVRSFLLVTRNNEIDHDDFFALTGGDPSRSIREFVFVASAGADGTPTEHSLLVSGHFDRETIFRLANDASATRKSYRGVAVLAVEPFAREAQSFRELRWLAIPDEGIAIFGSVASVERELDRWIGNTPTDPELLARLNRLDPRDETWCLLPAPRPGGPVAKILGKLDARLEELAEEGRSIQYGVHIGKNVVTTASNNPRTEARSRPRSDRLGIESIPLSSFFSGSSNAVVSRTVRVKIRRQTYETWLAGFSGSGALIDRKRLR